MTRFRSTAKSESRAMEMQQNLALATILEGRLCPGRHSQTKTCWDNTVRKITEKYCKEGNFVSDCSIRSMTCLKHSSWKNDKITNYTVRIILGHVYTVMGLKEKCILHMAQVL
jgi:hypothetical protein